MVPKPLEVEGIQNENLEEAEMGQLHAIHNNMNAIAAIRAKIGVGPGLTHCQECGDKIPKARRLAVPGVSLCVDCQEYAEKVASKTGRLVSKNEADFEL
jgi:phage/conjugal plasmid C-4 type zinc finger TraR family protein